MTIVGMGFDTLTEEEKKCFTNTLPILPSPEKTHPNLLILAKEGDIRE